MHKKFATVLVLAAAVIGVWFSVDAGQVLVAGPVSITANALAFNPCRQLPFRTRLNLQPDAYVIDGCIDPIDPIVDMCPNLAGIQAVVPAGYEIDAVGNCVIPIVIPNPIDLCPNIAGAQTTIPPGYQIDGAGNCVLIPVALMPACTLSAIPASVTYGNGSTLSWTTTNANTFSISNVGLVATPAAGTQAVSPLTTTTYVGTAQNTNGSATCTTTVTVLADTLNNAGFETAGTSATNAFDWQNYGNGYTRIAGGRSGYALRAQNASTVGASGAYQRIDLLQTIAKPVFIGGWVKGTGIVMAPGTTIGAAMYAEIYFTDGTVAYWNSIPNSGTFSWRWIGFNTGTLLVQKPIDHIFVIPILSSASGVADFDDIAVTTIEPTVKSGLSIVFDDGESPTYSAAKPAMDAYGYKGSAAIVTGEMGQPGFMTSAEVLALAASGWEMMAHTITHSDLTLMTLAQAQQEISQPKTVLAGLGINAKNFAFPFGAYNAELIGYGQNLFTSMRAFEQGDNPQGAFPYDIKVRGVTNATTASDVASWLQQAKAGNRWVVLVFHTIASTGDDAYYTTPAVFAQMLTAISQSGVPVITYNQGLQSFATVGGPQPVGGIVAPPQPPTPPIRPPINPCGRFGGLRCVIP